MAWAQAEDGAGHVCRRTAPTSGSRRSARGRQNSMALVRHLAQTQQCTCCPEVRVRQLPDLRRVPVREWRNDRASKSQFTRLVYDVRS